MRRHALRGVVLLSLVHIRQRCNAFFEKKEGKADDAFVGLVFFAGRRRRRSVKEVRVPRRGRRGACFPWPEAVLFKKCQRTAAGEKVEM